ncbi:MAG TPA: oxygenase MpaB family protein [Pseudonocardia sp.]|jgi:uncharacterized protein (DUF2236 family)
MWEETGLVTFSLSTGSAFLLQTMEPSIAAVVDEHSVFRTDAVGRGVRSIASVMTWIYGGPEALAEADRLRAMHARLASVDEHGVRHTALASRPWAWVLLTGVHAFVQSARYFSRRPLTEAEKEAFYQENVQLMRNFAVPEKEIPATYADYLALFEETVRTHLRPTRVAHDFLAVSRTVPPPPALPAPLRPLWRAAAFVPGRLQHFVTVGTTPPVARRMLGLEWTGADERRLRILGRVVAHAVPLLPERLRYFPIAYEGRRLERARQRLRRTLDLRPL